MEKNIFAKSAWSDKIDLSIQNTKIFLSKIRRKFEQPDLKMGKRPETDKLTVLGIYSKCNKSRERRSRRCEVTTETVNYDSNSTKHLLKTENQNT